jgi:hypothetical protein
LLPDQAQLAPGDSLQFSASGRDRNGDSLAIQVSFTATGGTITAGGRYHAGGTPGNHRVVATAAGTTIADSSAVTIVSPNGAPVRECDTPRPDWVWCDDFEQDRLGRYFEFNRAKGSFARVPGTGASGSYGMRARFATGQVDAGALHLAVGKTPQAYFRPADQGTANYRELYWRFYLRNAPGWIGGGGHKATRATIFGSSTSWAQAMVAHVWSGGPSHNHLVLDPASGTDVQGNLVTTGYNDFAHFRWLGALRGATPLFAAPAIGTWHCVETRVTLNAAGQSNGMFTLWIDGRQDAERTDLNWVGGYTAYGLNAVFLENYWNNGAPADQERYFDNFVVATGRIGC